MKNRLTLLFLFFCFYPVSIFTQIYSFEDGLVPISFSSSYGNLKTSTSKFKLGRTSLEWDWNANAKMTIVSPTGLSTASTSSSGGITLWIYNTVPSAQKITIGFSNSSNIQKCKIDFNLNFKGWRCLWAQFKADMNHDQTTLNTMTVSAPTSGSGILYFDYLEFPASVAWTRMSDLQYKVAQTDDPHSSMDNFVSVRSYNIVPLTAAPALDQKTAIDTIFKRLDNWYLSTGSFNGSTIFQKRLSAINSWISKAKTYYSGLDLQLQNDGTVLGDGLFSEEFSTSIAGSAVKHFRNVNEACLIPLALDYRKNNIIASKTSVLNVLDWYNDQGWADGSALGSLRFEKLRSGGYYHSLYLMRNDLGAERLQRELSTLKWLNLFGNVLMPINNPGENTDNIRSLIFAKMFYALMQPDNKAQVAGLFEMRDYLNNSFSPAPGYLDAFKPDFSGYHHSGVYFGAYYPQALYVACFMYYLLHDTPYSLSDSVYNQLKNCLLTFRNVASIYDVPMATCGRFPTQTSLLDNVLPAFAYLALSKQNPDNELLAAFGRLWQPTVSPLSDQIGKAIADITYTCSLGETELCQKAASLGVAKEHSLQTQLYLPYSGLLISRDSIRHVSIKGFSKYISDYESSTTENLYGRYLSYGQIEYTSLSDRRKNNAYSNSLWDWSRIPGTTTKYLDSSTLKYTSSTPYRNFSDDPFLGGVILNDSASLFSMKLHDNAFDKTFYAYKSIFCFGNALICIGSNITNNASTNRTETTLFQQEVLSDESMKMNGTILNTVQTGIEQPTIQDNLGNRFIVKTGNVDISINGNLYSAVINHGYAPKNKSYTYYMLLKSNDLQESKFKNTFTSPIEILRQDKVAHIVKQKEDKVRAYAIFDATATLTDEWIKQVNSPSLVMIKQTDISSYKIVISDPDMRRLSAANTDALSSTADADPGESFNYQIVLYGNFKLTDPNQDVTLTNGTNTTTLTINVREGKTYSVTLTADSTGLNSTFQHKLFWLNSESINNWHTIFSASDKPFNVILTAADGRLLKTINNIQSPYLFDLQPYSKGVYVVGMRDSMNSVNQKIIVK